MASTTVDTTKASSVLSTLSTSTSNKSTSTTDDIENRFLTLLVAQLENQDPLNPMQNAELTSQLSQMSTVRGIEQLNTTLNSLVGSLADTQAMQASALIGKAVLVPGKQIGLTDGKAYAGVNLATAAEDVTVKIYDSTGKLVQTQSLGKQEAGNQLFAWDGKNSAGEDMPNGAYTFQVSARAGEAEVASKAMQLGTVSALTRAANGNFVLDLGTLGQYNFGDIQQVF